MEDLSKLLRGHPIFSSQTPFDVYHNLSLDTLSSFKSSRGDVGQSSTKRRNIMALRESDIILAVGNEIRIACLTDTKSGDLQRRSYKILHTPNIEFDIHQIVLNSSGKLLAVAGTHQIAVISLPRSGYSKLVTSKVDCRTIQVGQFYHATASAPPIAKIEWHPWGKNACTILIMTTDGTLREYDVSIDPEEPQQTLPFMPERSRASSCKGDNSTREVTSFCFGKSKADWGPLTVYALTKSGDIWAMCPFLPSNATVPSAYIHALEYFVRTKEELATNQTCPSPTHSHRKPFLSTLYAYQLKYALSLSKQLPTTPSTLFPSPSRLVPISAPSIVKAKPKRQGPFLFQPAPRELGQGEGGDATDLIYLSVEGVSSLHPVDESNGETLGILLVAYSDGKLDVCLDVEKIEAMWESSNLTTSEPPVSELPMVTVYETIDLGLVSMLSKCPVSESLSAPQQSTNAKCLLDILQANHPVIALDPIYEDTAYLYHAFGVHRLNMGRWLRPLVSSLRGDTDSHLANLMKESVGSDVTNMIDTFSPESRSSHPIASIVIPSDVYLSYGLLAITSSLDIQTLELALRVDSIPDSSLDQFLPRPELIPTLTPSAINAIEVSDGSLLSLLSKDPYQSPQCASPAVISAMRRLPPHSLASRRREVEITSETLRQFATVVDNFRSHIRDLYVALHSLQDRLMLQDKEFQRQQVKYVEVVARTERLRGPEQDRIKQKFERTTAEQKRLLGRSDRLLQELMDTSSPELNEHEKRWFAELKRMKVDVLGEGNYDSMSLKARTNTLAHKIEYYLPRLEELAKWEHQRQNETAQHSVILGRGQELRVMMRLGEHKKMLSDSVRKIGQLAASMNIVLEDHPSLQ